MSPIQQMLLGAGGAVATKTYVDDLFSTFLYTGTGSAQTINNGIDLANEGGMVWFKARTSGGSSYNNNSVVDTERVDSSGRGKSIYPNLTSAEYSPEGTANITTSFNSNGFTTGTNANNATNTQTLASWTFRKAPGFFDVVAYTGDGSSSRQISHSLGSVPGMVIVKNIDSGYNWTVWHKSEPTKYAILNNNSMFNTTTDYFGNSSGPITPTSTYFTVNGNQVQNGSGVNYIAYVFAGGESTAATARSVDFDGSGDSLTISNHADINVGTGDYTLECSFNFTGSFSSYIGIIGRFGSSEGYYLQLDSYGRVIGGEAGGSWVTSSQTARGVWNHVALVRQSGAVYLYLNGLLQGTVSGNGDLDNTSTFGIGDLPGYDRYFTGKISNVRLVKGTAVYTSSFKPPTEPLTNITNTKLLCCNNSSTTGSTVTPGTITANGDPTASTDSPFDDPAGFAFGNAGDQNVIKCGSYVGNGSATGPEINLGWEPQYILLKNADEEEQWQIFDSMRGIVTDGNDPKLLASNDGAESSNSDVLDLTPTGFKLKTSATDYNGNNDQIIYICIRRPDGYCGKPPELGTGVFTTAVGVSDGSKPGFPSGFVTDFAIRTQPGSTQNRLTATRLTANSYLYTNSSAAETGSDSDASLDYNTGFGDWTFDLSGWQAWQWKRHAGLDVVAYGPGNEVEGRPIPHQLNKIPEMIWLKNRDSTDHWAVYHKGLNGGTNPEQYYLWLETTNGEDSTSVYWNNTAPTSTHFTVGNGNAVNQNNKNYIAMLFASVDGISKVGYYDGSDSEQTITTGFQPRFVIIKRTDGAGNWNVLDTTRGWGSGNDPYLVLNADLAQTTNYDIGAPTATGFTLTGNHGNFNKNGREFIFYAHA